MVEFIGKPSQERMDVFKGRNIIDISSLTRDEIETIMQTAAYYDKALAEKIMSKAPLAIATAKTVINNGYNLDMKTASALEIEAFTGPFSSEDKIEGMSAFLEKRDANFQKK